MKEEVLDLHSIHGTTTGENIFKGVTDALQKNNLQWKNLSNPKNSCVPIFLAIGVNLRHLYRHIGSVTNLYQI